MIVLGNCREVALSSDMLTFFDKEAAKFNILGKVKPLLFYRNNFLGWGEEVIDNVNWKFY